MDNIEVENSLVNIIMHNTVKLVFNTHPWDKDQIAG